MRKLVLKNLKRFGIFMIVVLAIYGLIYVLHPMPFLYKLDILSAEVTNNSGVIIYKTDEPTKVDAFFQLFNYNTPYFPWQQNTGWKIITSDSKKLPPDVIINFNNDLGETRYSFAVKLSDPSFVHMQVGFYLPWSKTFYPLNPAIANWKTITDK